MGIKQTGMFSQLVLNAGCWNDKYNPRTGCPRRNILCTDYWDPLTGMQGVCTIILCRKTSACRMLPARDIQGLILRGGRVNLRNFTPQMTITLTIPMYYYCYYYYYYYQYYYYSYYYNKSLATLAAPVSRRARTRNSTAILTTASSTLAGTSWLLHMA